MSELRKFFHWLVQTFALNSLLTWRQHAKRIPAWSQTILWTRISRKQCVYTGSVLDSWASRCWLCVPKCALLTTLLPLQVSIGCPEKMEPITKVSHIPASRWALSCSLCREHTGTCIQVRRANTACDASSAAERGWGGKLHQSGAESFIWETLGLWRGITVQSQSSLQINGDVR